MKLYGNEKERTKKIALTLLLALLFAIEFSLAIEQPLYARDVLPRSIGDLGIEGSFKTSEFTGAFVYDHKIEVPPGTNGLTPQLSIFYVSQRTPGIPTVLGTGWDITQTYIERDINGSIYNTSDDKFRLVLEGSSYDLLFSAADNRYHTQIESFLRIEDVTSGGNNTKGQYWIVKEKDGKTYRFGFNSQSETLSKVGNYTLRWYVDLITDTYDNSIFYTYNEDPHSSDSNATYLNSISYNNDMQRIISFAYETSDRPDLWKIYQQGNYVKYARRLKEIYVWTNNSLVRKYVIQYSNSDTNGRTLLSNITLIGSDNSTSLPPTIFDYNAVNMGFTENTQISIPYCLVGSNGTDMGTRLADVNGDGLIDIIRNYAYDGNCENSASSAKKAFINTGSGWAEDPRWEPPYCLATNMPLGNETGIRLADVNGDGLTDIVRSHRSTPGDCTSPDKKWALINNGSGWTINTSWDPPYCFARQSNDTGTRFAEVNGDGLIDIIVSQADSGSCDAPTTPTKKVYINNGNGWTEDTSWNMTYCIVESSGIDLGVKVIDVNGDGLDDIIRSHQTVDGGDCGNPNKKWALINNGTNWVEDSTWAPSYCFIGNNSIDIGVRLIDANGDGLPDIIRSHQNNQGGDCGDPNFRNASINNGNGWTQNTSWEPQYCFVERAGNDLGTRVADINGDGLADIIRSQAFNTTNCENLSVTKLFENKGNQSYLLKKIKNSNGGETFIEYKKSTSLNNTGNDTLGDLGFNLWVVSRITRNNNMSGSANVTFSYAYNYSGGFYDYPDKELRGFNSSQEIRPDGTRVNHYFHQDDARAGRMWQIEILGSNNALYQRKNLVWNHTATANKTFVTELRGEETYTFDNQTSNPRITNTTYSYDSFGNVLQRNLTGDVNLSGDERYETFQYAPNTVLWIVGKPIRYLLVSNNNTLMKETNYSYDGLPQGSAPTKGSVTRKVESISKGKTAITLYSYNSHGNMININDSNNRTTNYSYGINDTTFTYADSETNAKSHVIKYMYDLGLGKITLLNDSNNFVTNFTYDRLGRIVNETRPFDSSAYPTKQYEYETDGIAPEKVKVKQREQSGTNNTFDTFQFIDGLGNVIQTKKESNSTKQIVIDTVYDGMGRVSTRSNPYKADAQDAYTQPGSTAFTNFTYDQMDRVVRIRNPDGTNKTFNYTKWNVTITDENGNRRMNVLDGFGQIIEVHEFNGTIWYRTNYTYDAMGSLARITDNQNNVFTFEYDMLGRKTAMSDPDMGVWAYTYDTSGNLIQQTDNRNIVTDFQYDAINRLIKRNSTIESYNFTYDTGKNGTLSNVTSVNYSTELTYDERLRITKETKRISNLTAANVTVSVNYTYDAMDRITTKFLSNSSNITYTYTEGNTIKAINGILTNITYNELDLPESRIYNNTLQTGFTYDPQNLRLTRIITSNIQNLSYTYDNASNVIQINDTKNQIIYRMAYDAMNRLISANRTDSNTLAYFFSYTYNSIGNILKIATVGSNITYTYGSSPAHAPSAIDLPNTTNLTIQVHTLNDTYFRSELINMTDPPTTWEVFYAGDRNGTQGIGCSKTAGCVTDSLIFQPTTTGTYTVLGTAVIATTSATPDLKLNLTIDAGYTPVGNQDANGGGTGNPTLAFAYYDPSPAAAQYPLIAIKQLNLTANTQYNISFVMTPTSTTGEMRVSQARILVFNPNVSYYAERDTRDTNANTADKLYLENNFTATQSGDYLILWTTTFDLSTTLTQARVTVRLNDIANNRNSIGYANFSTATDSAEKKHHGGFYVTNLSQNSTYKVNMSYNRLDATAVTIGIQNARILVMPIAIFTKIYYASDNTTKTTNNPVAFVNNSYTPTANKTHIKLVQWESQSTGSSSSPINVTIYNATGANYPIFSIGSHVGDGEANNFHSTLAFWSDNTSNGATQMDSVNSTRVSGTSNVNIRKARLLTLEFPSGGSAGKSTPESNQSKIVNNGGVDENAYLLMKVQYYNNTRGWVDEATVINDTTPRAIAAGQTIALDTIWNAVSWNTSSSTKGYGTYRVWAAATDENDTILYNSAGQVIATHNFTHSPVQVSNLSIKYINHTTERIYHFAITNRHNTTLNDVAWTLNTGNGTISSQLNITLQPSETILTYVFYNYTANGNYDVIARATSSSAFHSNNISVTI